MSYYAENPYERRENPRCIECDEFLTERRYDWICTNPECPNCDDWRAVTLLVDEIPPEPENECEQVQAELAADLEWLGESPTETRNQFTGF